MGGLEQSLTCLALMQKELEDALTLHGKIDWVLFFFWLHNHQVIQEYKNNISEENKTFSLLCITYILIIIKIVAVT